VNFRTAQAPIPNERPRCLRLHVRRVIMTWHTGANPVLTAPSSVYQMTICASENPIFSSTAVRPSNIVPYASSKYLSLYIQYQQAILHIYTESLTLTTSTSQTSVFYYHSHQRLRAVWSLPTNTKPSRVLMH